jgi:hypothetical protein
MEPGSDFVPPWCGRLVIAGLAVAILPLAHAQDMEPRSYANAPVDLNFLVAGYAYTRGGVPQDTALPLTDMDLTTSSAVLGYGRVLNLWGQSAKLNLVLPLTNLSGTAQFAGQPVEREVSGLADPLAKLSVNLYGAPALSVQEYAGYRQDLILGASLQVTAPLGQYDDTRVVNIGTNRWSFKPELGVSQALGPWTLEGTAGVRFFTDNDNFYGGHHRSQDPIYSMEGHLIYSSDLGFWGSLDVTHFSGGRTRLDGERGDDLQKNWRLGGTLAFPLDRYHSVKLYASSGVSARTGNDFDLAGILWQYRWGGGL